MPAVPHPLRDVFQKVPLHDQLRDVRVAQRVGGEVALLDGAGLQPCPFDQRAAERLRPGAARYELAVRGAEDVGRAAGVLRRECALLPLRGAEERLQQPRRLALDEDRAVDSAPVPLFLPLPWRFPFGPFEMPPWM